MKNTLTIITDDFENEKTGEKVKGITIIIDGVLKLFFDKIIEEKEGYDDYPALLKEALFRGLNSIKDD